MIIPAAKGGGIVANNTWPATFIVENLQIEMNLIASAHEAGVDRLLFLGSSCVYPKSADQPIEEASLLTGPLEETNQWYAVAKIAGINGAGLPPPAWPQLHLRRAHQPLRTRRQL